MVKMKATNKKISIEFSQIKRESSGIPVVQWFHKGYRNKDKNKW